MKMAIPTKLHVACLCLWLLSGCSVNPVSGKQDLVLMSEQQEIALGRDTHQQILQQYKVYENPGLQRYVQQIGENIATNSHRNNLVYRFTVLDSNEVNAFALPGGYIYITRGIMAYLQSEAELSAVLAHEIGHVTARHSVRQYSATQLANIGALLATTFIPNMNQATTQLTQLFGTALLRGYGREHELEADRLGAEYLARSNYDSVAMLNVIRVLKNQSTYAQQITRAEGREPQSYHALFATHPDNDKRLQEVIAYARNIRQADVDNIEGEYLHKIDGMLFGVNPKEGILRNNRFYHVDLGFGMNFPKDWVIKNLPNQLLAKSTNSQAMIQITLADLNLKISPRQFIYTRLGIKQLSNERSYSINGLSAHTGIVNNGKARITVLYFDQRAYIMVATTTNNLSRYDNVFNTIINSFHPLSSAERTLAKPLRIKVIQAKEGLTFKQLAKQSALQQYAEKQLRLINGQYFKGGEPKVEELIKVID